MSRIRSNLITNQSADGAPTVENGLVISGVTTSSTFSGSGASLTNVPAAQLSGTAAAINGSNITNLNGSNIASGTVPVARIGTGTKNTSTFYRGDGTFATVTAPAITAINSASNNRIVTSDGGTTVTAEANLTFETSTSGGTLTVAGTSEYQIKLKDTNNSGNAAETALAFTDSGDTVQGFIGFNYWGDGNLDIQNNNSGQNICFNTDGGNERLRITDDGQVKATTLSGNYHVISSTKDGSTSARAATSAWEIKKTLGPQARTGYYYLKDPYDGTVSQWWCDMDTDGGGWILVAHVGDGAMSPQSTNAGNHWYSRNNRGGFDTIGSGYYMGGGYWRASDGSWGENTCGQLMWDVRTHGAQQDNYSVSKVVFNWGTDQALPSGASSYSNIPNASNRRFNEWCYEVVGAPGFNPGNYHQNQRSNVINGMEHFTEHMVMTFTFRNTGGGGDAGADGPYWMIGSHHDGLHQHYEESLSGSDGVYGDGGYQVVSNEDTSWGSGASNGGYDRRSKFIDNLGTCNIWLR